MEINLSTSLNKLKGVGPNFFSELSDAGLYTVGDLIYNFPKRHDDYSQIQQISKLKPGKVFLKGRFRYVKSTRARRGLHITQAELYDESGGVRVVWFNQPYRAKAIKNDTEYFVTGEYGISKPWLQITNPSTEIYNDQDQIKQAIVPVYKETKGIKSHQIYRLIAQVAPLLKTLPEILPFSVVSGSGIISYAEAIYNIHLPTNRKMLDLARQRLGFDELFILMMASKLIKNSSKEINSYQVNFDKAIANKFVKSLPFLMTESQKRASWEILQDIQSKVPMDRLLEGDVGSGKTVVAAFAIAMVVHNKFQVALIAPTELLARQHFETLKKIFNEYDKSINISLLTGSLSKARKSEIKSQLQNHSIDILVGTHALLQKDISWGKLGLLVVDEQHRFGVEQRQELLLQSKYMPHILCLTATPIPRSLALTVYGELKISVLNKMPDIRSGTETKIISPNSIDSMYTEIEEELNLGRQVYVVCPIIEESDALRVNDVTTVYDNLRNTRFKNWKVGLLHGRLKTPEKEKVMRHFVEGKIDILVSTTVVEVGVDVHNASVMAIFSAERFGLAQLHQLRGRVGRGKHPGRCYLVLSDSLAPSRRMRAIESCHDGFKLAELDLKIRGPGSLFGLRQHGILDLSIADITDAKLIKLAQNAVESFMPCIDDLIEYSELHAKIIDACKMTRLN